MEKPTKQKITNKAYRQFLDQGIITTLTREQINQALQTITHTEKHNPTNKRTLLLILYLTGCRPNEALQLEAQHIQKEERYITIQLKGSKGGLPRKIYLKTSDPYAQEIYNHAQGFFPQMLLFHELRNNYTRTTINKKGETKTRTETTDKLRYYFNKWFKETPLTPYFLRHNRFSKLSEEGIDLQSLRMLKGSRTYESITPYLHMSSKTARNIAKKIN
jgi:site-specific recombinase XerD